MIQRPLDQFKTIMQQRTFDLDWTVIDEVNAAADNPALGQLTPEIDSSGQ